jgi:hypothetical protein
MQGMPSAVGPAMIVFQLAERLGAGAGVEECTDFDVEYRRDADKPSCADAFRAFLEQLDFIGACSYEGTKFGLRQTALHPQHANSSADRCVEKVRFNHRNIVPDRKNERASPADEAPVE